MSNTPSTTGEAPPSKADATPAVTTPPVTTSQPPSVLGTAAEPVQAPKDAPPADPPKDAPPAAPAAFELKSPEGVKLEPQQLEAFKGVAQELGLDAEKAQKLVNWFGTSQGAAQKAMLEARAATESKWVSEIQADKEFMGADGKQFEANARLAKTAVAKFGGEPLRQLLNATGLGNHPVMARVFLAIGKAMGEDKIAGTSGGSPGAGDPYAEHLRKLYPTMHKE